MLAGRLGCSGGFCGSMRRSDPQSAGATHSPTGALSRLLQGGDVADARDVIPATDAAPGVFSLEAVSAEHRFPFAGLLRRARRSADLSQRQLAARAKLHHSVVSRIEAERHEPSLTLLTQLLRAAGVMLVAINIDTDDPLGPMPDVAMRDAANRYFPAHLDVRRTRGHKSLMWWDWWYYHRGRVKPLASFRRNRARRDLDRRQDRVTSVWYDERELLAMMYPGRRSREPDEEFGLPW